MAGFVPATHASDGVEHKNEDVGARDEPGHGVFGSEPQAAGSSAAVTKRSQAGHLGFPLAWIRENQLSREDLMSGIQASGKIAAASATGNPQSRAERASH